MEMAKAAPREPNSRAWRGICSHQSVSPQHSGAGLPKARPTCASWDPPRRPAPPPAWVGWACFDHEDGPRTSVLGLP